jgi:5-methyltetrahydropteroyltriglutamate--homocysteine methyltransferase
VNIQQNTDRIQTTHIGSLPRPHKLLDIMKAKYSGQSYDEAALQQALRSAVAETVREQVDCGLDIVTDGEFSKPGFFTYIRERLDGYESRPSIKVKLFQAEVAAFPEYYAQYFQRAMMGGTVVTLAPVVCAGPVKYRGDALVATSPISRPQLLPRASPTSMFSCRRRRRQASASTNTTNRTKTIFTPSRRR